MRDKDHSNSGPFGKTPVNKRERAEIEKRFKTGEPAHRIARDYGVAVGHIHRLASPKRREALLARGPARRTAFCENCGKSTNYRSRDKLCPVCRTEADLASARPTELLCAACRLWKSDDSFRQDRRQVGRRGRRRTCITCSGKRQIKRMQADLHGKEMYG